MKALDADSILSRTNRGIERSALPSDFSKRKRGEREKLKILKICRRRTWNNSARVVNKRLVLALVLQHIIITRKSESIDRLR